MDNSEHGIKPEEPNDAIHIQRRFPGELSNPPAAARPAPPRRTFSRVVLPLIVFVLVIGGVAWVMQYMPNRKTAEPSTTIKPLIAPSQGMLLTFDEVSSIWDRADKKYIKEFERTENGHFDFPFQNNTDENIHVGLLEVSCTCSDVKISIDAAKNWQPLPNNRDLDIKKTVLMPARSRGIVRVSWKGGRLDDPTTRIKATVWMQPEKRPHVKHGQYLETMVRIVPPVMYDPQSLKIGELSARGSVKTTLDLWSATRPDAEVTVSPELDDELIDVQVARMSMDEQRELQKRLLSSFNSRIKAAWRAEITVYEQNGKRQQPQGPFKQTLAIHVDGEKLTGPSLTGFVPGEVRVGGGGDGGAVKLEHFSARSGTKKRAALWTDNNVALTLESHRPGYAKVRLSENKKDSTPNQRRWDLDIEIPPGGPPGTLPDDSAVILKTQSASPRQIYIPLRGTATPG